MAAAVAGVIAYNRMEMLNRKPETYPPQPRTPWSWFTEDYNKTDYYCCSKKISYLSFTNPVFGTKCTIKNIKNKTMTEIIDELCEIKELEPILHLNYDAVTNELQNIKETDYIKKTDYLKETDNKCVNYICKLISDPKNKNVQSLTLCYCSKCGKCYDRHSLYNIVYKWCGIPYYWSKASVNEV